MSEAYSIKQIDEGFYSIEENGVRIFVFVGENEALIVDTGYGTGDLTGCIRQICGDKPVRLVNSHADRDHIGGNTAFKEAWMHPAEYDRYQAQAGTQAAVRPLWEGDRIDIGGRCFEILLIPGHTPGSIALLDEKNRILLAGDSVQAGTIYMFGPGRNIAAYQESIQKLVDLQDRFDCVYASHGPETVEKTVLPALLEGAAKIQAGEIPGKPVEDRPAELYDVGVAAFLYA